jgi:hypothetical protein
MNTYTNTSSVPLSLAVFLATDNYDHDSSTISVTSLIKPLRQLILAGRVPPTDAAMDLVGMVASRMGTAIHDGIEQSWRKNYVNAMLALNYPQRVIKRIAINPKPEDITDETIPIYLEQRSYRQMGQHTISGKFDFVGEGRVEDFKTTSTYTAMNNTNDTKYIQQGSLYRWLNPTIITKDEMAIQFIFTDWSAARARSEPNYPQSRIQQRILPLQSVAETERFVTTKLAQIDAHKDTPEESLPLCTDEDLWRSVPVYKYYKNPEKTARSTKNFDSKQEAMIRNAEDGGKGIVVERPGQVTACKYCNAFSVCTQKDALIAQGDLIL